MPQRSNGGGTELIGGDYHGLNPDVQDASRTYLGPDASIDADATQNGNGGKVILWSNDGTQFYGSITARGGSAQSVMVALSRRPAMPSSTPLVAKWSLWLPMVPSAPGCSTPST